MKTGVLRQHRHEVRTWILIHSPYRDEAAFRRGGTCLSRHRVEKVPPSTAEDMLMKTGEGDPSIEHAVLSAEI